MNEIVCVHVGGCGVRLGIAFWDRIRQEHQIGADGVMSSSGDPAQDELALARASVFFRQTGERRFTPRAVFVDLEPGTLDALKTSGISSMLRPDNFVFGASGAGNNFAKGYYTEGAELVDEVLGALRAEALSSDSLQGFLLFHALGGGTGSGLGSLLLSKLRDEFPGRIVATCSVFPSPKTSDVVVEPYNAVLTIRHLIQHADMTFVVDNEALFNIAHSVLKQSSPGYEELNGIAASAIAGATAPLRSPCSVNSNLRSTAMNLVPFPRLHFLDLALTPFLSLGASSKVKLSVSELAEGLWSSLNSLVSVKQDDGKVMAAYCGFRGDLVRQEIRDVMAAVGVKTASGSVAWIPRNTKSDVVPLRPADSAMGAVRVSNTTAIKSLFQRLSAQFAKMYKRKAFVNLYRAEGMSEAEFQEADLSVRSLISEYQDKQDAVAEVVSEEVDGDDEDLEDGDLE